MYTEKIVGDVADIISPATTRESNKVANPHCSKFG